MSWYWEGVGISIPPPPSSTDPPGVRGPSDPATIRKFSTEKDAPKSGTNDLTTAQIFISLSSDDGRSTAKGAASIDGGEQKEEEGPSSPRSAGALAEYFSSLFDETFCSHTFKLVGSRIFSSGKFQEEQALQATRETDARIPGPGGSTNSLGSSGSSSELLRVGSGSQLSEGEAWGWYDEIDDAVGDGGALGGGLGAAASPAPKATPPYILTESLSAQRLWRETAGKRPQQPSQEREFFEEQWAKNFSDSEVDYSAPLRMADAEVAKRRARENAKVIYRAASPFGSAVSKSFKCDNCGQISSIMVHIPKFQIVQTGSDVHAEYLIVVGLGTVTLGVWRRFTEFKRLAKKLSRSAHRDQFHNALCSWRCLLERQRWFRCLDRDYLILKTFLLERFLHDLVFESVSPNTVRDFLGVL